MHRPPGGARSVPGGRVVGPGGGGVGGARRRRRRWVWGLGVGLPPLYSLPPCRAAVVVRLPASPAAARDRAPSAALLFHLPVPPPACRVVAGGGGGGLRGRSAPLSACATAPAAAAATAMAGAGAGAKASARRAQPTVPVRRPPLAGGRRAGAAL